MKILLVDDCDLIRTIMKKDLNRVEAFDCDEAKDGREAVAACKKNKYDVVLMDWNMPNMSGLEAVKSIRAGGDNVPIIMVTTEAEKNSVIKALKAGANNYIVKPFQPDLLLSRIKLTIWRAR